MGFRPSTVKCMSLDAVEKIFFGEKMNVEFIYLDLRNILLDKFLGKPSQYLRKHVQNI